MTMSLSEPGPDLGEFEQHRRRLLGLARHWVGCEAEAEDIMSEAWLRWVRSSGVRDHGAFLSTVVSRLCADHLKSARVRRERHVGTLPPEQVGRQPSPGTAGTDPGPYDIVERDEELRRLAAHLLERLSPAERAVLVLRVGFGYSYQEIAGVLHLGVAYCRQLYVRGRTHLAAGSSRFRTDPHKVAELTRRLRDASRAGEMRPLESLLAADVVR